MKKILLLTLFLATISMDLNADFIEKACDGGDAVSCFLLGNTYYKGQGVRQDFHKAKELFGKACDGGNAMGCKFYARLNINIPK